MLSAGLIVFFSSLAITACYLSYLSRQYHFQVISEIEKTLTGKKAVSRALGRKRIDIYSLSELSEEKDKKKINLPSINPLYRSRNWGIALFIVLCLITGSGLILGSIMILFYEELSTSSRMLVLVIAVTYGTLVYRSKIAGTRSFIDNMTYFDDKHLKTVQDSKNYHVLKILSARKRQFLVISGLLCISGIFGLVINDFVVVLLVDMPQSYLSVIGIIIASSSNTGGLLAELLVLPVSAVAILLLLVYSLLIIYLYIKMCLVLIRIKPPDREIIY